MGLPLAGHAALATYQDRIARRLSERAGVPCSLGGVQAGLTGSLRLRQLQVGTLFAAEAVEVAISWPSLLDGEMQVDEVTVEAPKLAISVNADGSSDLAQLLTRLAAGRASHGQPHDATQRPPRRRMPIPRRIVVSEGELAVSVAGLGSLRAQDVELVPSPGGVRAVAGRVHLSAGWHAGAVAACPQAPCPAQLTQVEVELARAAADLALPSMTAHRVLAVGGHGTLTIAGTELALRAVSAARMQPRAPLTARLTIDDHGAPRTLDLSARMRPVPALAVRGEHLPLWPLAALAPSWLSLEHAHFSGELAVSRGAALGVAAAGSLQGPRLQHAALAAAPIELAPELDLVATVQRSYGAASGQAPGAATGLELSVAGSWTMGAAAFAGTVEAHRGAALSAAIDLTLAPASCQELLGSVPRGMAQPLEGLTLAGDTGGRLRVAIDTAAPLGEGSDVLAELTGACRATAEPPGADVTSLREVREHVFPDGSRAAVGPGVGAWIELRSLPAHVDGAFVAAEDARFFSHRGFDLTQIARSLEIDLREGRLARGGSTISQQLVKNEFLDGRRSLARKLTEAILTWRLEARLDKREILERYLNIIELGPSIWGVAAAAQHWFGVSPRHLSVRQAAFLAALTPEPTTMTRRIRAAGGLDRASATRLDTVLRAMKRHGLIDQAEYEAARGDDLDFRAAALRAEVADSGDGAGAARRAEPPHR